ncbi:hypothetical protein CR513_09589, partial [Mucuna pruriens]
MLDQLHKTPARISFLSLLINFEGHRELLLKVLNDDHVPQDITPEKFGGIINNITASCHLSFSEAELPTEGKSHKQPLYIAVKFGSYMIARVLIDNGSSLNVIPKATLDKLYLPSAMLKSSPMVVKAFDSSKQEVMGKITLPKRIGPTTFDITFQVKFIVDGQLISVMGEKDLIINTSLPNEYVKGGEEAFETSFQALKIVGMTSSKAEKGHRKLSKAAIMAKDWEENLGVAKKGKPGQKAQGKQEIRPNLYRYFINGGIISSKQVAMIEDQPSGPAEWIYPTIDSLALVLDVTGESSRHNEEEKSEEEALIELERLLEQEGPTLQFGTKELETINLGEGEETKDIRGREIDAPELEAEVGRTPKRIF